MSIKLSEKKYIFFFSVSQTRRRTLLRSEGKKTQCLNGKKNILFLEVIKLGSTLRIKIGYRPEATCSIEFFEKKKKK